MGSLNPYYVKLEALKQAKENLEQKYRNRELDHYYIDESTRLVKAIRVLESQVMNVGKGTVYLVKISPLGVNNILIFESNLKEGNIFTMGMDEQAMEDWAKYNKLEILSKTKIPMMELLTDEQLNKLII